MALAGKATSEAVIIEQITNQIHIHMNVKDLQVETNRKLEVMSSRLDVLATMTANATKTKRACEGNGGVGSSTPTWNYQSSPTFTTRPEGIPPWNQSQYKYCQPLFDSWRDMRRQIKAGSLRVFTGGLGGLMVEGEYEVWVCAHKDPCALGETSSSAMCFKRGLKSSCRGISTLTCSSFSQVPPPKALSYSQGIFIFSDSTPHLQD